MNQENLLFDDWQDQGQWPPRHRRDDWVTSVESGITSRDRQRFRILVQYYLSMLANEDGLMPEMASDRARMNPRSCGWHRSSDLDYWGRIEWTGKVGKTTMGSQSRVMRMTGTFWAECQKYREAEALVDFLRKTARHDVPPTRKADWLAKTVDAWSRLDDDQKGEFCEFAGLTYRMGAR